MGNRKLIAIRTRWRNLYDSIRARRKNLTEEERKDEENGEDKGETVKYSYKYYFQILT